MALIYPSTEINGVVVVCPEVFSDERGSFVETYRSEWFPNQPEMLQSNRADRIANTIVGLHYHLHQSDYWYVPQGQVQVVLHDLRIASPTERATTCIYLGAQSDGSHCHDGVYIPPGVAHGFAAITDCTLTYLVDAYYNPTDELGVCWNDPEIAANWDVAAPLLSQRDRANPKRHLLARQNLPHYSPVTEH